MKSYEVITGELKLTTAMHIGSGQSKEITDATLRRDVQGRIVIPGTAIAGLLRTIATRLAPRLKIVGHPDICRSIDQGINREDLPCGCAVCHLFGDLYPGVGEDEAQRKLTRASRLWVYDAYIKNASVAIRDGVGIARSTGTAASVEAMKFDLEVLPPGTLFDLRLELEDFSAGDAQLLVTTLAEFQAGRGRLGGRSVRGLGAFTVEDLQYRHLDLSKPSGLEMYLENDKPWDVAVVEGEWVEEKKKEALEQVRVTPSLQNPSIARTLVEIFFDLTITGPFLTHDATLAGMIGFDYFPQVEELPPADQKKWLPKPVLPGSGLRGVLRSHSERIARTLATISATNEAEFREKCPACDPTQSNADSALTSCDTLLKQILRIDEVAGDNNLCLACRLFGSLRRGSRFIVDDAPLIGEPQWKAQDFLSIDRFTGGGLEGAKFDALALWQPSFSCRMLLENPQTWELGWLTLTLRDLYDGLLAIGFGIAKGYGNCRAENFTVKIGYITDDDLRLLGGDLQSNGNSIKPSGIYKVLSFKEDDLKTYKSVLTSWIGDFESMIKTFSRREGQLPQPITDTYFDGHKDQLYPLGE